MSVISNPAPAPNREPGHITYSGKRSTWKILAVLAIIAVVALATWRLWSRTRQAAATSPVVEIRTAQVTSGPLEQIVRLSGVTSSINYYNIRAPMTRGRGRSSLVLLELIESGIMVEKGDVVGRIDGQRLRDNIDDQQDSVQAALGNINKLRAQQAVNWENLQQNLRIAKADLDGWKLDASAAEVRTVIDQELIKLSVEEAEATLEQQRAEQQLTKTSHTADLRILALSQDDQERELDRQIANLNKYTITAPMSGMAVREQIIRSGEMGTVEVGDQIRPGMTFIKIIDTSSMQVEATINQAESKLFRIGQKATIGLDAFPELKFTGEVYSIGALATGSQTQTHYVRNIPIRIRIDGSNEKLIPDLSASADVIVNREDNILQMPRGAVFEKDGQSIVYVRKDGAFEERSVTLGVRNPTYVAIISGLEVGEEVALDQPPT